MSHDDGIAEELQGELSYTEQRMLDRIRRRQTREVQPSRAEPGEQHQE